jgi:L-malate glycosyltransferase
MKLLVIGHSYVSAYAQKKYVAMKRENPSLEVRLLTPRSVPHPFMRYESETAPEFRNNEVIALRDFFFRSHMTYLLDPMGFAKELRRFKPDYIHVEEDPHSLIAFETVLLTSIFCPKTPLSFFVWDNIARMPAFPLNLVKQALTRLAFRRACGIVAGNQEAQSHLRGRKGYEGPTQVIPQLGIDLERYEGKADAAVETSLAKVLGVPLIGFIGRLVPEKGILLLCEALQRLKELPWKLLIIGNGPLRGELVGKWAPAFGSRLLLREAVSYDKVPEYLKSLDIFVLPSYATPQWKEQFGLVLTEAMAAGAAVIGSSSGAIPEVVGDAGLIFKEGDSSDLESALRRLLQSREERQRRSALGRARAVNRFSHKVVSSAYMKTFMEFGQCQS